MTVSLQMETVFSGGGGFDGGAGHKYYSLQYVLVASFFHLGLRFHNTSPQDDKFL